MSLAGEKLIEAATEILAESGMHAVTVSDVCRRAGYSRQTAYVHFGNVATLKKETARYARKTNNERAITWLDMSGWEG